MIPLLTSGREMQDDRDVGLNRFTFWFIMFEKHISHKNIFMKIRVHNSLFQETGFICALGEQPLNPRQ